LSIAVDILHHDIMSVAVQADIIDVDDVGVAQVCCRLGLVVKALQEAGIGGIVAVEHLHRDAPVQAQIAPTVDPRHAAFADLLLQLITVIENLLLHCNLS
jgi:hypothetical protein